MKTKRTFSACAMGLWITGLAAGQTPLVATTGPAGSNHGVDVASIADLDGDGLDDVLIGESGWSFQGAAGAVRAYSGADGTPLWTVTGGGPGQVLGVSLAVLGDLDGDGVEDFVAGAPGPGPAPEYDDPGSAHVFSGADQSELFVWHGDNEGDSFGANVAAAGDVDGDGVTDVAVAATNATFGNVVYGGYVRVFSGADGATLHTWYGRNWYDEFGTGLAGLGDVNLDGYDDVAASSPNGTTRPGIVRVFCGKTGGVLKRIQQSSQIDQIFGSDVCAVGDVDGDGRADMAVGARGEHHPTNPSLFSCGSVRVYSAATGVELHVVYGLGASESLGDRLAFAGDWDGDGFGDYVANGPLAPNGAERRGVVRVLSGRDGTQFESFLGPQEDDELRVAATGELNGDGKLDVIAGGFGAGVPGQGTGVAYTFLGSCDRIESYCTAGSSAAGCTASLSATGTASSSAPSGFAVQASGAEAPSSAILFFGTTGRQAVPFLDTSSLLCVRPPLTVTATQSVAGTPGVCEGTFAIDLNAYWNAVEPGADPGPGAFVRAQVLLLPSGGPPVSTDALEFTVCP